MWNKDCRKNVKLNNLLRKKLTHKPRPQKTCLDVNVNCLNWAKAGQCDKLPNYMLINCKKSCNNCAAPPPPPTTTAAPIPTTTAKPKPKCDKPFEEVRNVQVIIIFIVILVIMLVFWFNAIACLCRRVTNLYSR